MSGKFVYVPDPVEAPNSEQIELLSGVKDINSVPEVADAFGVCAQTIRRLIASGELESFHIGRTVRVTKSAMLDFMVRQGARL